MRHPRHHYGHPHLAGYPGYDTVGFGLGNIVHALNPVNIVKAAGQMAYAPISAAASLGRNIIATPFNIIGKETNALRSLFGYGGGGSAPQAAPPGYPPGYGPPPGYPPQMQPPPGYGMPPMSPPTQPMYDPNQYLAMTAPPAMDTMSLYGPNTGWDASYGGGQGAGW